jgi:hypothetical protein
MVTRAQRITGSCKDYVKEVAELLPRLGIDDTAVSELWHAVQKEPLESMMGEIRGPLEFLNPICPDAYRLLKPPRSKRTLLR